MNKNDWLSFLSIVLMWIGGFLIGYAYRGTRELREKKKILDAWKKSNQEWKEFAKEISNL